MSVFPPVITFSFCIFPGNHCQCLYFPGNHCQCLLFSPVITVSVCFSRESLSVSVFSPVITVSVCISPVITVSVCIFPGNHCHFLYFPSLLLTRLYSLLLLNMCLSAYVLFPSEDCVLRHDARTTRRQGRRRWRWKTTTTTTTTKKKKKKK